MNNNQEPIFEDVYHKQQWDLIIEEIKKIEFGKEMKFNSFSELKTYCCTKLNRNEEIPLNFCFACEYAEQFECKNKICENCPFKGIDIDKYCLNYIYHDVCIHYKWIYTTKNEQIFNHYKQKCIEDSIRIRYWKIRDTVLYRSQITQ